MKEARFVLTMTSEEYGQESFSYDTLDEGLAGLARLARKRVELKDDIVRSFVLTEEQEYGDKWPSSDLEDNMEEDNLRDLWIQRIKDLIMDGPTRSIEELAEFVVDGAGLVGMERDMRALEEELEGLRQ